MEIFPKRRPSERISRQKRPSHALKNGDFSGGKGENTQKNEVVKVGS